MKSRKCFVVGLALAFSIFCVSCSGGCASTASAVVVTKKLDVAPTYENAYFSSVEIQDEKGRTIGSGTILKNEEGYLMEVLTAWHVVDALNAGIFIKVPTSSQIFRMTVAKHSKLKDLCLLKSVDKMYVDGPFVKLSAFNPRIGSEIFVIGNPMGASHVVNKGNVSDYFADEAGIFHFRVSAPVIYGNSGGGLFNKHGRFLGVVVSIGLVPSSIFLDMGGIFFELPGLYSAYAEPGASFVVALDEVKKFLKEKPKPSEVFVPIPEGPSF